VSEDDQVRGPEKRQYKRCNRPLLDVRSGSRQERQGPDREEKGGGGGSESSTDNLLLRREFKT